MLSGNKCRCCLGQPPEKDLRTPYIRLDRCTPEVYLDMLEQCFNIQLTLGNNDDYGICEVCVGRLQDASDFKLQVQRSQVQVLVESEIALHDYDEKPEIKLEMFDDDGTRIGFNSYEELPVKPELVNEDGEINELLYPTYDTVPTTESTPNVSFVSVPGRAREQFANCSVRLERLNIDQVTQLCQISDAQASNLLTNDVVHAEFETEVIEEKMGNTGDIPNESYTFESAMESTPNVPFMGVPARAREQFTNCSVRLERLNFDQLTQLCQTSDARGSNLLNNGVVHAENETQVIEEKKGTTGSITNESYTRDTCDEHFTLKCDKIRHLKKHVMIDNFSCNFCSKKFNTKDHLKRHSQKCNVDLRTKQKSHACNSCSKVFSYKSSLQNHVLIHSGVKPFVCEKCNKRFRRKDHLVRHTRVHTGEKTFMCDICALQCRQKSDLDRHKLMHSFTQKYKSYMCDICGLQFRLKCHFECHKRKHSGIKPYFCEKCNKQFKRKDHLDRHIRVHTGEKPFMCEICGMVFSRKIHLDNHKGVHGPFYQKL